jgi:hypothetical protein
VLISCSVLMLPMSAAMWYVAVRMMILAMINATFESVKSIHPALSFYIL